LASFSGCHDAPIEKGLARELPDTKWRALVMLTFILPVFLLIALVAVLPIWRHSKKWSFYPLGGLSLLILIVLILFWTGHF
jgi:hypothetical protein